MKNCLKVTAACILLTISSGAPADAGDQPIKEDESVVLTSKCKKKCQKMLAEMYPFKRSASIMGRDKAVSYVILSMLDGVRGTESTNFDPNGSFNSSWSGGFEINTSPGTKSLLIYPTALIAAPDEGQLIEFEAAPGKTYLVASLQRRVNKGGIQINNWVPLVMEVGTNKVLLPEGEPQWREYCFAAQEFGSARPCPDN